MLNDFMVKMFGASWKPTVMGLVSAFFFFVTQTPETFPHWMVEVSKFATLGGLAGLGISAKGSGVTGGDTPNNVNNPLVVSETSKN